MKQKEKTVCKGKQKKRKDCKQKKRLYAKGYMKQKQCEIEPLHCLISKFHNVVSQGPLYTDTLYFILKKLIPLRLI